MVIDVLDNISILCWEKKAIGVVLNILTSEECSVSVIDFRF